MSDSLIGWKWDLAANADPEVVSDEYGYVEWRGIVRIRKHNIWKDEENNEHVSMHLEEEFIKTSDTYKDWIGAAEGAMELGQRWVEAKDEISPSIEDEVYKWREVK
jgi:hypothetical protein